MKKNKLGVVFMVAGAVLIASALFVLINNRNEDENAGRSADVLMPVLQEVISENIQKAGSDEPTFPLDDSSQGEEMTVTDIDGYGYIGYISLPTLGLELPVMSEWDYSRLKIAPCRQFGCVADNNLVIAGHNYKRHFGRLSSMQVNDPVSFTDMNGNVTVYTVSSIEVLSSTAVDEVQNSEWDLVIYTCTYGGASRVVVGCSRVK